MPPARPSRMLDDAALADYLDLPLAAAKRVLHGRRLIEGHVRWDLVAIDAWLDGLAHSGGLDAAPGAVAPSPAPANSNQPAPDAALDRWVALQHHPDDPSHAARRP